MKNLWAKLMVAVLLFSSVEAFAWGLTGHRIVAEIANHHLKNRTKRELKKIFGNEDLVYWANWPDFIKSDTTDVWKPTFVWHYVNIEPQRNFAEFKKELEAQAGPNLYTQIKVLSSQIKNKNTSPQDKKTALIFLVHLMGDLAQPMHTGREGDLGGNNVKVTFFGRSSNLHRLWDSDLIDSQKYSYSEYARLLDIKSKSEVKRIQSGSLEDWAYQSHQLANDIYANTPNGAKLAYDYEYKYIHLLENQLLNGGLHLAKVLNDLF